METSTKWLIGGAALATIATGAYLVFRKQSALSLQESLRLKNAALPEAGPALALPPKPKVGAVSSPVYTAPSYVPTDNTSPSVMGNTQRMTIRQIQGAMNLLGASLKVDGLWDMPTQQAVWDFQYIHQKDNPSTPLNVTGEVDQLTQNAIQAAIGKKANVQTGFY